MAQPTTTSSKKRISLSSIATLLVVTSFAGQLLGFLRTKLVSNNFPVAGPQSTDAYFAAFTIPDFFFFTIAAGALGVAFMPVLLDRYHKGDKRGVWQLSASLMNLLAMIMGAVGLIIFLFAEPLIHYIVAPNMSPEQLTNAVTIMRLIAFNPMLFTISGILTSAQQTFGRFFFYAISPLFYNVCIIVSIFLFKDNIGLVGLGIGALAGALLQLLIVVIGLNGLKFHWHPKIMWHSKDFKQILRQLPARSIDQGIDQVGNIIDTHLASRLGQSFISYYNYAYTLQTAPILLIGTAISTAAFPRLASRLSQNRPDLFRRDFLMILRILIWIILPVAVVCYYGRGYLARMIFGDNAPQIATIFGYLTVAIIFRSLYAIISRWFYAQKDSKTPLYISIFTIALNVILSVTLSRPNAYGVVGLAIAQSIVAFVEVVIMATVMWYRDAKLFDSDFLNACSRIISVTGFTLVTGAIIAALLPLGVADRGFITLGSKLAGIAVTIFVVHIAMSSLFGLEEVRPIINRVRKLVTRPIRLSDL
ncbi:MAG: integral rane protein MviN [Candidatus Saccharibacteria bacterium]|nr:integral rane protein MviN [Candidatus Saccharibacteria bacterium]